MAKATRWIPAVALMSISVVVGLACEDDALPPVEFSNLDASLPPIDAAPSPFDAAVETGADAAPNEPDAGDASDAEAGVVIDYDAGANLTDVFGSGAGQSDDVCPAGQVMVGAEVGHITGGFYNGVATDFRVRCGTPKRPDDGTDVTIDPGATVPTNAADARGSVGATVAGQTTCPANEVLVGMQGRTIDKNFPPLTSLLAYFEPICAPLQWSGGTLSIGTSAVATGAGSSSGTAAGPFLCQPTTMAVGMRVFWGDVVNGLQMRCVNVTLP